LPRTPFGEPGLFYCPKEEKVKATMGRPLSQKSLIEELSLEITAAAMNAVEDLQMAQEVKRKFERIAHAANFITSVNSGLRNPKDEKNAKLAEILGEEVLT
jgi:hypothetical protein